MTVETTIRNGARWISFYACEEHARQSGWNLPAAVWLDGCNWEVERFDVQREYMCCEYARCYQRSAYRVTARQYRTHEPRPFFPTVPARPEVSNAEAAGAAAYLLGMAGYGLYRAGKAVSKRRKRSK